MLSYLVDIQRTRQYMTSIVRTQLLWRSTRADIGFLGSMRRGLLPLPFDRPAAAIDPFPPMRRRTLRRLSDRRVAVIATGGSGALASMVGVVRALEEAGVRPVGYGVCSGSALFGIPLAAGMPAGEVARAVQSWSARDYLDPGWWSVITAPGRLGQGWAGLLRGDRIEETYRRMLGDVTLGELPTPVWLPVWNIEDNRLEYLGPDTHPEVTAARAVRMAVALPIAIQPNELDGGSWLDGGIVDIIPAEPFVDTGRCDLAIVVNCFYPAGFTGDEERRWRRRPFSIVHVANQTRTMQHLQLARRSLADLRRTVPDVIEMEPVAYSKVQGAGLYGQFLESREWAGFMTDGYHAAAGALRVFRPAEARVG